jgi:hypothetical protein
MAKKKGLYANIHAKRGAPTAANFKRAKKTAKKKK